MYLFQFMMLKSLLLIHKVSRSMTVHERVAVCPNHWWVGQLISELVESIFCHYLQEKRLDREALISVSENFQFHAEAVHTTAKLDRRYSALVEVSICLHLSFLDKLIFRFTCQVWYLHRCKLVDPLWRIGVVTCDAYQRSTSSWDMACTDHMYLE